MITPIPAREASHAARAVRTDVHPDAAVAVTAAVPVERFTTSMIDDFATLVA